MIKIEFSHSNNGGYFWLTDSDWDALQKAGWEVFPTREYFPVYRRPHATILANDVEHAKALWAAALPHFDPNDEGCTCCSAPFTFEVAEYEDDEDLEDEEPYDFNMYGDYGDRSDFYEPYDRY